MPETQPVWTKLYDESRTPAHWLDIIRPGEYAVFVLHADSRAPADRDGRDFRAGEASVIIAPHLAAARDFAEKIVAANPKLCCEIYDHHGKSGPPVATVYESSVRGRYEGIEYARRNTAIGVLLLALAAAFIVYDARHDLVWLWGYIVGLKLLIIGSVFLVRGTAGIIEHRSAK